jgi:hypothetical protein
MFNRKTALMTCVVVAAAGLLTAATQAWAPPKANHLTFKRSVALPGVVLPAGTYTSEAGPANNHPDIVQVRSRDNRRVLYTGFTVSVRRPAVMSRSVPIVFGEAPAGEPMPIAAWYPVDSSTGHEFLYR